MFFISIALSFEQIYAQKVVGDTIVISNRVGKVIDLKERNTYKLFSEINGFKLAVWLKLTNESYVLKITYQDETNSEEKVKLISLTEDKIKRQGEYIDHFEEIQAGTYKLKKESSFVNAPIEAQAKIALAVIDFEAKDVSPSGVDILSNLVRTEVLKSPKYTLVDRDYMNKVLKEQNFQLTGSVAGSTIQVGKILGVKKMITGSIGRLGNLYIVNLQIIDVESAQIEKSETQEFIGSLEDLRIPVRIATQKLIEIEGIEVSLGSFIHVSSQPEGAKVYMDGLFEGNTPIKISVNKGGIHNIKITSTGYEEWKQNVQVKENNTSFVNTTLLEKKLSNLSESERKLNQDGRKTLIAFMSLYSIFLVNGGLYTIGIESDRPYVGATLIGPPIGFFLTLNGTKNSSINGARTGMIISSTLWGSLWGVSATAVLQPKSPRPYVGLSILSGALAFSLSMKLTSDREISGKRVSLINLGAFLGSLFGLGLPYLLNVEDPRIYFGSMLAGGLGAGYYAIYLTRNFDKTGDDLSFQQLNSFISVDNKKVKFGLPIYGLVNMASSNLISGTKYDNPRFATMEKVTLIHIKL
jgi:hypothetical protein